MSIQWFPGHMHKAQKEIRQVLSGIDVVIEVLDARIPYSSQNPLLASIRGCKPCIRLLHKSDLADPALTTFWQAKLVETDANPGAESPVIVSDTAKTNWVKTIAPLCRQLATQARETRPLHALIVGIPNVGKSTLINLLAGRAIAKTGNEPAITRAQQRVDIGSGVVLRDTPGVLWPNLEHPNSGYRLAVTGAIRDTAIDSADVAMFAAGFLAEHYPEQLQQRYTIELRSGIDSATVLAQIGRQRGAISRGGLVDFDRAGRLLLTELRSGALGRITLETPSQIDTELEQLQQRQAEKARQVEQRRATRRQKASQKRPKKNNK